ncbi:MAG: 3D domain-containing protein [Butyricicoccus sp.]
MALTATGTTPTEGRTIAVDLSVIPLGSRVFIEGYGVFIAETPAERSWATRSTLQ